MNTEQNFIISITDFKSKFNSEVAYKVKLVVYDEIDSESEQL